MPYTIREAAKISGLPESTLRYYENIGLIDPIQRDDRSKYRIYNEDDVNLIVAIACLNATGLSIEDMRQYLKNREAGSEAAKEQIDLLQNKKKHLEGEIHFMRLRQQYLESKIEFWEAVKSGDKKRLEKSKAATYSIADKMKLPKVLNGKN